MARIIHVQFYQYFTVYFMPRILKCLREYHWSDVFFCIITCTKKYFALFCDTISIFFYNRIVIKFNHISVKRLKYFWYFVCRYVICQIMRWYLCSVCHTYTHSNYVKNFGEFLIFENRWEVEVSWIEWTWNTRFQFKIKYSFNQWLTYTV